MTYFEVFDLANKIFYVLLAVSAVLLLNRVVYHIYAFLPSKKLANTDKKHKFAIIIPARNESKVIKGLLDSIQNQNYDQSLLETYVIIENESDPTNEIASAFANTNVFIRRQLELKGKGHAMNEVIVDILKSGKVYDAFMIFDADNVLYPNFFEEMNKSYAAGHKISMGRRNSKNWNDGWVATCSALTFSFVNSFQNKYKTDFGQNIVISGSGFYVDYEIIKNLGGWPFHTLTEDYEITMWATQNGIRTHYNPRALMYDEQVTTWRQSWKQRLRWVKGFGQVNKIYKKDLMKSAFTEKSLKRSRFLLAFGVTPLLVLYASIIIYSLFTLFLGFYGFYYGYAMWQTVLSGFAYTLFAVYSFFVFYAVISFLSESPHCTANSDSFIKSSFMYPIFMGAFLVLYVYATFKKEVEWAPIEHKVNIEIETGEQVSEQIIE